MLDHRNLNTLWASIIVETLFKLGLRTAVISPGSRSTPLTMAFAQHGQIETLAILDERSAAFFALGKSKHLGLPVALICTSGTAGANFYPAIIEAKYSQVPLLIFTADRPRELRDCRAGQTIDQVKLYGNYPNWQTELTLPEADLYLCRYLRETIRHSWEKTLLPIPGPVHVNCPFREPLAPVKVTHSLEIDSDFFNDLAVSSSLVSTEHYFHPPQDWLNCERGVIIAGLAQPRQPQLYCEAIAALAVFLGWPVLAEALSPLRNYAEINPYLISTYDFCLRYSELASLLSPELVIQIGELPTSKELRQWLAKSAPKRWIISDSQENLDSLHGKTSYLRGNVEKLSVPVTQKPVSTYLKLWCDLEIKARKILDQSLASQERFFEGKVAWLLSLHLPTLTPIFLANSMSVRYAEYFWVPGNRRIVPYFSRGANGIDGTLSTALGMAHGQQSAVLLTGDLALLHDTNGFLTRNKFRGHLTIILVNNQGGGIFAYLPVAEFTPYFEEFFATPQNVNFADLCQAYQIEYHLITTWEQLTRLLNPLPETGIRVLELKTDRQADSQWLETVVNSHDLVKISA